MSISPPSDILLDVASAADPAKVRAATEKLAKLAADPTAANQGFSQALAQASQPSTAPVAVPNTTEPPSAELRPPMRTVVHGKTDAYQKFEALMLQSFVENMLPSDDGDLYGDKMSAGAYRSMMAEQLSTEIAKAGGIGIAKSVEKAHPQLPAPPLTNHA